MLKRTSPINENSDIREIKRRKCVALSMSQKVELLKKLNGGMPIKFLCDTYEIGHSSVYDLKK